MIMIGCITGLIYASSVRSYKDEYDWECEELFESQININSSCDKSMANTVYGNNAWIKHKVQDGEETWHCEEVLDQMYKQTSSEPLSSLISTTSEWIRSTTQEKISVTDDSGESDPTISGYERNSLLLSLMFLGFIAMI